MHFRRKEQEDNIYLDGIIDQNVLLTLTSDDYQWAKTNAQRKDFEYPLQMVVATRTGCYTFVTLDHELAKVYAEPPINIQTI